MKHTNHFAMQAGVIGSNWGRVHVAGLRQAGCQVQALMAHDAELVARIAAEEQIPHAGTELTILDGCELVAIATTPPIWVIYRRCKTEPSCVKSHWA